MIGCACYSLIVILILWAQLKREDIFDIADNMTYLELSTYPGYMDELLAACFIPHTDSRLFE